MAPNPGTGECELGLDSGGGERLSTGGETRERRGRGGVVFANCTEVGGGGSRPLDSRGTARIGHVHMSIVMGMCTRYAAKDGVHIYLLLLMDD